MQVSIVQYDISWEDKSTSQAYMNAMLDASPPHEHGFVLVPELCDVGFSMNLEAIVDDPLFILAALVVRRYFPVVLAYELCFKNAAVLCAPVARCYSGVKGAFAACLGAA